MDSILKTNSGYSENADAMLVRYEARDSAKMHADWLHLFPASPASILDIGAGTGRDAAWLAAQGHTVTAAEPTAELREPAKALHPSPNITWIDDRLPHLEAVSAHGETYDFILSIAVWMHLTADERAAAMPVIAALLAPKGRALITLRHGLVPEGRRMFEVTAEETTALAAANGLTCIYTARKASSQPQNKAEGIEWSKLAFEHAPLRR